MVTNVNIANQNIALSVQTKKAIRTSDPEAWAMVKRGLAPKKDLSSVPTLTPGTLVSMSMDIPDNEAINSAPVHENTALSVQTKRAIRASDPEAWAMIRRGLAPKQDLSSVPTPTPGSIISVETERPDNPGNDADRPDPAPENTAETNPRPRTTKTQPTLRQAIDAYTTESAAQNADELEDLEELFK